MYSESEYNRLITRELESVGAVVFSVVASVMQTPGWPDRYVAHKKWTGWIEGKMQGQVPKAHQRLVHQRLRERGVPVVLLFYSATCIYVQGADPDRALEIKWGRDLGRRLLLTFAKYHDWFTTGTEGG